MVEGQRRRLLLAPRLAGARQVVAQANAHAGHSTRKPPSPVTDAWPAEESPGNAMNWTAV
eukprot:14588825-Alexandrium_andersonii.AAC.1